MTFGRLHSVFLAMVMVLASVEAAAEVGIFGSGVFGQSTWGAGKDTDGDGTPDSSDAFPLDSSEIADSDADGIGDNADAFPQDATETSDLDGDGVGDNTDAFPNDALETSDTDSDGIGNNSDNDDDGDGTLDVDDALPLDPKETLDTDLDGVGNNADNDDDGDGVSDIYDRFPLDVSESVDTDNDGVGDNADAFPNDSTETIDTDSDGVGNNTDEDDDGDGESDIAEAYNNTDPLNKFSCSKGCFSFDIDQSETLAPLTDGLLVIRHLFGFSGTALISNAIDMSASRQYANEISTYLTQAEVELDIDGSGDVTALTDGLLLIRYLFGFSGESLVDGAIGTNATRVSSTDIEAYIKERIPSA